jgi:hypothetical protein
MAYTITITGDADNEAAESRVAEEIRRVLRGLPDVTTATFDGAHGPDQDLRATAGWQEEGYEGPERFRSGPTGATPPPQLTTGHRTPTA